MPAYFGVIHKSKDSAFGISWPDLPGCTSASDTLDELDAKARAALFGFLEILREDGEALPEPSTANAAYAAHCDDNDFYGVTLVSVPEAVQRKAISLRVDELDLDVIDKAASARRMDRTTFMVEAAKEKATKPAA